MANLNKLLVHVPSSLCSDFRNKYIKGTDKSYDNKVVFLEDTKEIFTKGEIYGIVEDFNALKNFVGTLPEGSSSNIVSYINDKFGEILGSDNDSYTAKTVYGAIAYASYVGQNIIGSPDDAYTATTVHGAIAGSKHIYDNVIGSDSDSYDMLTMYGLKRYATYEAQSYSDNVALKMTEVIGGTGIDVKETQNIRGKKIYTVSTSAKVFYYKGNKTKITELPSINNIGDVWSVGPAKATDTTGSTLYAWDGDEWINLGSAHGVSGVNTTKNNSGISLTNTAGIVGLDIQTGPVGYNISYVVTGGTAYNYINNLSGASYSTGTSYIDVRVETKSGNVSYVGVTEKPDLKNAVSYANSALQEVEILGYTLNKSSYSVTVEQAKSALELGEAAYEDMSYFNTYFVTQASLNNPVTKTGESSYIDVSVTTYNGKVETVTVTPKEELETSLYYAYHSIQSIGTFSNPYISITNANNNKSYYVNFDVSKVFSYVTNNIWETYPPE